MESPESNSESVSGKHAIFVQQFSAAHRRLLGFLVSILGNRHDAEDVLQRSAILLWKKLADFEEGTDFWAWASTVVYYEAMNFRRVAARSRMRLSDEVLQTLYDERSLDKDISGSRMDALQHCLEQLDEPRQRLLRAVYHEGAEIRSLAEMAGLAPQTLYNRLNVLRRLLADCIERRLAEGNS